MLMLQSMQQCSLMQLLLLLWPMSYRNEEILAKSELEHVSLSWWHRHINSVSSAMVLLCIHLHWLTVRPTTHRAYLRESLQLVSSDDCVCEMPTTLDGTHASGAVNMPCSLKLTRQTDRRVYIEESRAFSSGQYIKHTQDLLRRLLRVSQVYSLTDLCDWFMGRRMHLRAALVSMGIIIYLGWLYGVCWATDIYINIYRLSASEHVRGVISNSACTDPLYVKSSAGTRHVWQCAAGHISVGLLLPSYYTRLVPGVVLSKWQTDSELTLSASAASDVDTAQWMCHHIGRAV